MGDFDQISMTQARQAPELRVNGKAPSLASLGRWCSVGVDGIKLRSRKVGGRFVTCRAWIREFCEALNTAAAVS